MLWKTEGYLIRYLGHPTLRHLLLEWALKFVQGSTGNESVSQSPVDVSGGLESVDNHSSTN